MDRIKFGAMLKLLADAWTDREYALVASQFAEDVFYSDPRNYTFRDRQSLLAFFSDDDGLPQSCTFHNWIFDEEQQLGVAELTYVGTYRYHGTVWIEVRNGQIVSWREYQHISDKDWDEFWQR
ncbi:MAG TPA: nuclear transport factor 2 family protein [Pyrinomonadaceae bacterium]|nr:nuclear transport factor 2 family protein [Pyrinomonadaceae bacterium]